VIGLPEGGWATLRSDYRDIDGEIIAGDEVIEVDADGAVRVVWSAFDALTIVENDGWTAGTTFGAADWTHANGLDYDPDARAYVVSIYFPECVVKIDRDSGATLWILGGVDNQLTLSETMPGVHAPEVAAGGFRAFENGRQASAGSRLVEFAIDETARTAEVAWTWSPDPPIWSIVLGDVHRFADGATLAGWGYTADIFAVSPAGELVGHLATDDLRVLGQVSVLPSLYPE